MERLAAYIRYAGDETCADYIEEILSEEEDLMMAETLYRKLTQEEIAYEEMESMRRAEFARNTELRYAREEGEAVGESRGRAEGENLFAALTAKLLADGRIDDLKQAAENADFRAALFEEYGIR